MLRLRGSIQAACVVLFAVAIVVAGCGHGSPTPTQRTISDPKEIIATSIARLATVTSVHVEATLDGSVNAGSLGTLSGGALPGLLGTIKLDGSSMSGDIDIANRAFRVSASFPSLFATTADVVQVDGYVYTKISLFGNMYTRSKATTSLPFASAAPGATLNVTDAVNQLVDSADATATLVGRDKVDGRDAYHVTVTLPIDTLNRQIGTLAGSAAGGITIGSTFIDYWAYVDGFEPARLEVKSSSASLGSIDVILTMTRYDQPVTINAPPAGQVQAG